MKIRSVPVKLPKENAIPEREIEVISVEEVLSVVNKKIDAPEHSADLFCITFDKYLTAQVFWNFGGGYSLNFLPEPILPVLEEIDVCPQDSMKH